MEQKNPIDIIVLNSHGVGQVCHIKRLPQRGETLEAKNWRVEEDGGKGATVSVALGRLGYKVGYIGKVGIDPWGDMGDQWMSESGVDTTFMYRDKTVATGTGLIMIDEEGYNTIVDGDSACEALTNEEIRDAIDAMSEARILITGFGMPFRKALFGAKYAHDQYKMTTLCNISPLPSEPMGKLDFLDYIVLNDVEAKLLAGLPEESGENLFKVAKKILDEYQCGAVVITCGENGSIVIDKEHHKVSIAPIKVQAVDTIGAGDGYLAAFAGALLDGETVPEAATIANQYAAYKVTRKGSMTRKPGMGYPMRTDFEQFQKSLK